MASNKQIAANRQNSAKSTGPKSAAGKAVAASNATRHGILSSRLFLPDEDPLAFQQLFDELSQSFAPAGTLEMILVEKIAVAVWKQRRIISAETAAIALHRQAPKLIESVNQALKKYLPVDKITENNLQQEDADQVEWSNSVLEEWYALVHEEDQEMMLDEMKEQAPERLQELQDEAEQEDLSVEAYLEHKGMDIYDWFVETKTFADSILEKHRLHTKVVELYEYASAELSILPDKPRASFERYQATLDNQLYRAIKELRILQDRRISMIAAVLPVKEEISIE